eukprot:365408-Chlamydomonas_euryale.AAC.23
MLLGACRPPRHAHAVLHPCKEPQPEAMVRQACDSTMHFKAHASVPACSMHSGLWWEESARALCKHRGCDQHKVKPSQRMERRQHPYRRLAIHLCCLRSCVEGKSPNVP